ncbi:hypothetical protein [Tropicibacter oceani]|uniref:Uncharacterized protein n=1 Tax=Tropicibacter oceani TaxID=3058420 RepID=A0ABY8QH67_9RHOB|nr:hypothetical protein [Tropicibacter oceani]WGW03989.1 hypothetical protein QF118_00175 [Tropicibacter oceani]
MARVVRRPAVWVKAEIGRKRYVQKGRLPGFHLLEGGTSSVSAAVPSEFSSDRLERETRLSAKMPFTVSASKTPASFEAGASNLGFGGDSPARP